MRIRDLHARLAHTPWRPGAGGEAQSQHHGRPALRCRGTRTQTLDSRGAGPVRRARRGTCSDS